MCRNTWSRKFFFLNVEPQHHAVNTTKPVQVVFCAWSVCSE